MLDGRAAHALGAALQQRADRLRPVVDVVAVHQGAADPVAHRDRQPAHGGGRHRGAAGLRLDGDQPEGLRKARHRDQVGGPVHVDDLIARLRRQERHASGDTEFVGQPNQPVRRGQPAARRPTGHHHTHPGQFGRGAQQHIGRLERLDAADERQHRLVGVEPEGSAGGALVSRREHLQVDAGVNHVDAGRVGVVQRNQLLRFVFGVDDQPVRLVDNLLFADGTQRRFWRVAVGQRGVLHRGQRVRGVHKRHGPAVPCQPADLSGEPVVRMHDVVVAGLMRGFGAQHTRREGAQLGGQVVFVESLEGPRHDVANQHARRDLDDGLIGRRRRAGEDLHLDAAAGHLQRALQHVDVHAARVAGARLRQR